MNKKLTLLPIQLLSNSCITTIMGRIKLRSSTYYKITNQNEIHHGFKYKTGINTLTEPFSPKTEGECVPGGLYFSNKRRLHNWYNYGVYIRKVRIPTDTQMVKLDEKYRADKIYINRRHRLFTASTVDRFKLKVTDSYVLEYLEKSKDSVKSKVTFLMKHRRVVNSVHICNFTDRLFFASLVAGVFYKTTLRRVVVDAGRGVKTDHKRLCMIKKCLDY